MSLYTMQIDDAVVTEQITNILNSIVNRELASKYSVTGDVVASAVKEIIYSRKDEIVEMVVERATKEIVRKGIPKLLEKKYTEDSP